MDNAGLLESTGVIKPAAMTEVVAPNKTIPTVATVNIDLRTVLNTVLDIFFTLVVKNAFIIFLLKVC